MDNEEIQHFKFDSYKIWMQKLCRAIFLLNSLKNQQQIDNAEIYKKKFAKFKIYLGNLNPVLTTHHLCRKHLNY